MRAFLLGLSVMLLSASPAAASEVDSFMAPIDSYREYVTAQADDPNSEVNKALSESQARAEDCAVRSFKSKKLKKRLRSKQGKVLQNYLPVVFSTDTVSQGFKVLGPRILQVSDQLDALELTELSDTAKAGAEYNRLSVEFFREKPGGSFACRFFKKAAALKSWTRKSLERTYLASMPRSASERQELTVKLDAAQAALRAGLDKMQSLGASQQQLDDYAEFFTLDGESS